MNNAKPIFLCKIGLHASDHHVDSLQDLLSNKLEDYHVLIVLTEMDEIPKFEVLNAVDATKEEIENLIREVKQIYDTSATK